jgi:predicted negative regulator of RcsB-dependent stress response
MDSEEREELKQNDLSSWLQYGLPIFLKKYGSFILLGLALCVLGYQLWVRHEAQKAVEVQTAWNELDSASSPTAENAPAKLQALIAQYQLKPVQAMAWLQIATFYIDDVAHGNPPGGYNGVKVSKEEALKSAESAANQVLSGFPDETVAVGKAHLALATIALDREDFDAAKKQYEMLSAKGSPYAETSFAKIAEIELKLFDEYRKVPPLAALAPPEPVAPTTKDASGLTGLPGPSVPTTEPTSMPGLQK